MFRMFPLIIPIISSMKNQIQDHEHDNRHAKQPAK